MRENFYVKNIKERRVASVIVMDYFEDNDTLDLVSSMSYVHTQHYFRALLRALACLNKFNFAHRDVKFSNFLCKMDLSNASNSKYKLIDFGLARDKVAMMGRERRVRRACNVRAASTLKDTYNEHIYVYVQCIT